MENNSSFFGPYYAAGGLAGALAGIEQGQQERKTNLLNTYQDLKNQEQEYTSAEAQQKMQDPRYIQMKLQNDMSKFGKETSINELESGYNKSTRAVLDLQIAAQQGPQVLQQKALSYLQEVGIDPNSKDGQLMLQDPVGFAQKTQQYFAAAATQNKDYQEKYGLKEAEAKWGMEKQTAQNKADMERQRLQSGTALAGQKYAADRGLTGSMLGYSKDLRGELDNLNTSITKLEGKELDNAVFDSLIKRGNKNPTPADIESEKSTLKSELIKRRDNVQSDLDEARGAVRNRIGLGRSEGTTKEPIKLQ